MRRIKTWMVIAVLAGSAAMTSVAAAATQSVVLELFTSHGCSSCPPADALLRELRRSPPGRDIQVIALSEHVDYWDGLGWPDRFSQSQFSQRQRTYVGRKFGGAVYTPALVINGRRELVGSRKRQVRAAVERAAGQASLPVAINVSPSGAHAVEARVTLPGAAPRRASQIRVALTQHNAVSKIGGGENRGVTLIEDGVVRTLKTVGTVASGASPASGGYTAMLALPDGVDRSDLDVVAFVQNRRSLAIVGAASRPLR